MAFDIFASPPPALMSSRLLARPIEAKQTGKGGGTFERGIFDIFKAGKRPLTPESTVEQGADFGFNSIQAAFKRIPLWFSNYVEPSVNATVDASIYWPLNFKILKKTLIVPDPLVDNFPSVLFQPPDGTHWIVLTMWLRTSAANFSPATMDLVLFLGSTPLDRVPLFETRVSVTAPHTTLRVPLIGCRINQAVSASDFAETFSTSEGIRPVYVGGKCNRLQATAFNGPLQNEQLNYELLVLEQPENQPFGPLISGVNHG